MAHFANPAGKLPLYNAIRPCYSIPIRTYILNTEVKEVNERGEIGGEVMAPSLSGMIFAHTDGGEEIVARMVDFMHGRVEGARAADQLAAARELMDRAWGKPASAAPAPGTDADAQADDSADRLMEMIAAALAADGDGGAA